MGNDFGNEINLLKSMMNLEANQEEIKKNLYDMAMHYKMYNPIGKQANVKYNHKNQNFSNDFII